LPNEQVAVPFLGNDVAEEQDEICDPDEGLIRRAYRDTSRKWRPIYDLVAQRWRAPSKVFELRQGEESLSVSVESSLRTALLPPTGHADSTRFYAARITVGDCQRHSLRTCWDRRPPNDPHHALILRVGELRASNEIAYEELLNALARASAVVDANWREIEVWPPATV
jgi:hypothetical protein